jgi:hypothetical protein
MMQEYELKIEQKLRDGCRSLMMAMTMKGKEEAWLGKAMMR